MTWVDREQRNYKAIGDNHVNTLGKWKTPGSFKLQYSGAKMPLTLESNEQPRNHPMLLSSVTQGKLKLVKDTEEGTVYMKDYDDYLQFHRAKGSGLLVVCISHWPET